MKMFLASTLVKIQNLDILKKLFRVRIMRTSSILLFLIQPPFTMGIIKMGEDLWIKSSINLLSTEPSSSNNIKGQA